MCNGLMNADKIVTLGVLQNGTCGLVVAGLTNGQTSGDREGVYHRFIEINDVLCWNRCFVRCQRNDLEYTYSVHIGSTLDFLERRERKKRNSSDLELVI